MASSLGRALAAGAFAAVLALDVAPARSADPITSAQPNLKPIKGSPVGVPLLDVLGANATKVLAPSSGQIGALIAIPKGQLASDFGLREVAPGIARLRGSPDVIKQFAAMHPDVHLEMAPPLHFLNDRVGLFVRSTQARNQMGADGTGTLIGFADTGLDVTHPDMLNPDGTTRVAWMLDLSAAPGGVHKDLEDKYGTKDSNGNVVAGRVFSAADIDILLGRLGSGACVEVGGTICAPTDNVGHGTHVTGIAAARGANSAYGGVAPGAQLIEVRVSSTDAIEEAALVTAVQFMFDRADFMKKPLVVNLSLGSDFGPHDGTFLWEQTVASYVGPDHPGRAIVAAAGNSGSIVEMPIHQSVYVSDGTPMLVPIRTEGANSGQVQVWITMRPDAQIAVGLDGPDGSWISPVGRGNQNAKNTSDYNAGIIYGSNFSGSTIPAGNNGAVVVWSGKWPAGDYKIHLEGKGIAELYMEGLGDAAIDGNTPAFFLNAVREGTINLPATNPSIIGVGCTVNRPHWTAISGAEVSLRAPVLDHEGGLPIRHAITPQSPPAASQSTIRDLLEGEVCWFSSSGPTAIGVPKPEIAAPGAVVISAMSRDAKPGVAGSVFTTSACPPAKDGSEDKRCLQIDDNHGIAEGTSMSSPVVAGVVSLLFQQDPTLTQDQILALLQAGAHRYRSSTQFDDYGGPGEVDAIGSLDALARMKSPALYLPALEQSWISLSSDWVAADGSTPLTTVVELRTADGQHRGDFFDASRLRPQVLLNDEPVTPEPALTRRGPGVWTYAWTPPPGLGGSHATFGATFDGAPIVVPKTLAIAPDRWTALYPSHGSGSGCAIAPIPRRTALYGGVAAFAFGALFILRRRRSR